MKFQLLIAGLAAWLASAAPAPVLAQAPVVTYHMDLSVPGEFSVFAFASQGDNFGIVCYGLPFDEATSARITSLEHLSPASHMVEDAAGVSGSAGFSLLRSEYYYPGRGLSVFAAQSTIVATPHLIRGLGQTAGSLAGLGLSPICPPVQPEWGAPLLLARGTYLGDASDFRLDTTSVDLVANVFADATSTSAVLADIRLTDSNGFEWIQPPPPDPIVEIPPAIAPTANLPTLPEPVVEPVSPPVVEPPLALPVAPSDPPHEPEVLPVTIETFPRWPGVGVGDPYWLTPVSRPIVVRTPGEAQRYLIDPYIIDAEVEPTIGYTSEFVTGAVAIDFMYAKEFRLAEFFSSIDIHSLRTSISQFMLTESATSATAVPEPTAIFLAALAACGLAGLTRRPT